jgi:phosphoribosylformimino-5-aminoimidazole carboxamide ribotide isomerase
MIIYPAVDIRGGRCVRLLQGRKDRETVYGDDPAAVARRWQDQGAVYIHVVDLDGAFTGNTKNEESVVRILNTVTIPIQLGGGVRSLEDMDRLLSHGVARVIIGTTAVTRPDIVTAAVDRWGAERIVVGIDARNGAVAVHGWAAESALSALDVARHVKIAGVERIVYTDIARDGMMTGPNVEATRRLARESGLRVIASGGVSSMDDLDVLAAASVDGVDGVIVGKALYEGTVDLAEAIRRYA